MSSPAQLVRILALFVIGASSTLLALGAILFEAAKINHADSDYTIHVTWLTAFQSVLWPPTRLPFLLLTGIAALTACNTLLFFKSSRYVGVPLFLLQVVVVYKLDGWLGWYFLVREFESYHFKLDAERLAESWFTFESIGLWMLAMMGLSVLRLFIRHKNEVSPPENILPQTA